MTFTYPEVTVGATDYDTFISLANAEIYLDAALHATGWAAATSTQKAQAIVTATRMLDRQAWDGEMTDADNALAWPRSGLLDAEGEEVDEDTIPSQIEDATCELAEALLKDASAQTSATGGSNVKRLDARGVSVEFFSPREAGRFPTIVQELVSLWLAGATAAVIAPRTSGTSEESTLDCDGDFDLSGGM